MVFYKSLDQLNDMIYYRCFMSFFFSEQSQPTGPLKSNSNCFGGFLWFWFVKVTART